MRTKDSILQGILNPGLTAVIRADSSKQLAGLAGALADSGVTTMEVTMTTPNALGVIREVTETMGDRILMGVGSVLDPETCRMAILAGAEFVVTPVTRPEVIRVCNRYGKPIICGAFTPTEALTAHEAGADFVKIFPANHLGPGYIKDLLAPLPMLRIIPTGGVSPETAGDFLKAGCVGLAAGSSLVAKDALKTGDWDQVRATAKAFLAAIEKAKREISA